MSYVIISVLVVTIIVMAYMWWERSVDKDYTIATLRHELQSAEERARRTEIVPLRTECRCKHDAYLHGSRGCTHWLPLLGRCACLATQNQVLYDPDPIRKMLPL